MATSDDPPFLNVGTEVSAKYRGAFCEATIKIAKKLVKCKISYTKGHSDTVPNDVIKGPLKIGANVEVRQPDGQYLNGTILKLTDATTYTVVFDDGDERTLKRSSLCLKGARHYSASESLDQMPLTDPENFGVPVNCQTKRGSRRRQHQSSSPEAESPSKKSNTNEYPVDFPVGKCVLLENDRRRSCWLPAVVVPSHYMDESEVTCDTVCIRSFKDGRFYACKVDELQTFAPDKEPLLSMLEGDIQSMYMCKPAIERAMAYLDTGDLPWDMELFDSRETTTVAVQEEEISEEQIADRENFYERLKKFHEERGITSSRQPSLAHHELNLYKLYKLVRDNGGMERVTQELKWRSLYLQLGMPSLANSSHILKQAYKRHLNAFECYEKAKEEGRLRNPRKRVAVPDSDEEVTLPVKQEKPDRKPDWSIELSDTESMLMVEPNGVTSEDLDSNESCEERVKDVTCKEEIKVNDRIKVLYGRGKTLQTYEAKVLEIDTSSSQDNILYYVHYNGWNSRHDEWIESERIAGKLTTPTKGLRRPLYAKKKNVKLKGKSKEEPVIAGELVSMTAVTTPITTPTCTTVSPVVTPTNNNSGGKVSSRRRRKTSETNSNNDIPTTSPLVSSLTTPVTVNITKQISPSHVSPSQMSPSQLEDSITDDNIKKESEEETDLIKYEALSSPEDVIPLHDTVSHDLESHDQTELPKEDIEPMQYDTNNDSRQVTLNDDNNSPLTSISTDTTSSTDGSITTAISTELATVGTSTTSTYTTVSTPTTVSTSIPTSGSVAVNEEPCTVRGEHDSGVDNSSGSEEGINVVKATLLREDLDFSIDTVSFADLCPTERITLIQERMKAIQKKYMELKSEVTYLERRKRKAKRRERENSRPIITTQDSIDLSLPVTDSSL